ncbi:MAG TPA: glycosyltransferase family 39 protein [Chloroflexota bacterium]|nr:glycosyltransferase family 39 protein [Chloroflexota bacterium]
MHKTRWWWLADWALGLSVLVVALATFGGARAKFDGDEAEWIGTAGFFRTLFVEHDLSPEAWPDNHWTRTQPMVARYVIGAWLWARGYDLTSLDPTYDFDQTIGANRRAGHGPSDALLDEARLPMRVLGALAVASLYPTVRLMAGPVGGLVAGLLAVGSPYLQEHLIRAKGDPSLMFFLLAGLLAAVAGLTGLEGGRRWLAWTLAAGALLGLAVGSKLTAVLGLLAVGLFGILGLAAGHTRLATLRSARGQALGSAPGQAPESTRQQARSPLIWAGVVLATAAIVFVASDPFLYPDPIGRSRLLFENRQEEMAVQMRDEPWRAHYDLRERAALVWERSFLHDSWGGSHLGWPLEAALAIVGACWLLARAVSRRPGLDALLLLWVACIFGGVTWGLGYRMQHYFVPSAAMAILLAGLAAGWIGQTVWRFASHQWPAVNLRQRSVGAETQVRPLAVDR